MKIIAVAGARPNFVKIAPLIRAFAAARARGSCLESRLVDTGQHYDDAMSAAVFRDLEIPRPDDALGVGSGSHAIQTAAALAAFEAVLVAERPDIVLVVGDVNSTLACALAAAKLGIRVAHVEAGLRSFDRRMPEEINRVLTDALADLLFTTEDGANQNLRREGIAADKIFFVGNVMVDSLRWAQQCGRRSTIVDDLCLRERPDGFVVVTLHRPTNVDSRDALAGFLDAFTRLACDLPVVFPAHPRTRARLEEFGLTSATHVVRPGQHAALGRGRVTLLDALPYVDCVHLLGAARVVLTDSGGVQEETTCLGVSCVTVRETTERPITVHAGTNVVAGTDPEVVVQHARRALAAPPSAVRTPPLWDGCAAERIVAALLG